MPIDKKQKGPGQRHPIFKAAISPSSKKKQKVPGRDTCSSLPRLAVCLPLQAGVV